MSGNQMRYQQENYYHSNTKEGSHKRYKKRRCSSNQYLLCTTAKKIKHRPNSSVWLSLKRLFSCTRNIRSLLNAYYSVHLVFAAKPLPRTQSSTTSASPVGPSLQRRTLNVRSLLVTNSTPFFRSDPSVTEHDATPICVKLVPALCVSKSKLLISTEPA